MSHISRFAALVKQAKQHINETDVNTVKQRIDAGERFHFIDIREESEWQQGHLPQAEYLGKGIIERDIEQLVTNLEDEIILYCGGGSRSALAALTLKQMGYINVASMDGGYRGWKAADYPIEG